MSIFPNIAEVVPAASSGNAEIQHVRLLGVLFCKLVIDGLCWMSDAPDERELNKIAVEQARGDVLLCGLGIGMILMPICVKPEVASVTVIERSPEVIGLVAPYYDSEKLSIVQADIWKWEPDGLFDVIWQDVIYDPPKQLAEVEKLEARLRPWLTSGGWLGSWNAKGEREQLWRQTHGRRTAG